ncbi:hypothetical protein [Methylobacterium fujisawaense]
MSFFGFPYSATEQIRRLDAATADNIAAQASLQQAGEEAARSTRLSRREAVLERRKSQLAARALREQPLRTSEVRAAVEEALADMAQRADHRAQSRH